MRGGEGEGEEIEGESYIQGSSGGEEERKGEGREGEKSRSLSSSYLLL